MAEKTRWCYLCDRYVVPKKSFNSIGWIGFLAALWLLAASASIQTLSQYTTTNVVAAILETVIANIVQNVFLVLAAPLLLISVLYCVHYAVKQPRCPICNAKIPRMGSTPEQS